jgi:hypothetical protein
MTVPKQIVMTRSCFRDVRRSILTLAFRACSILDPWLFLSHLGYAGV